MRAHFELLSEKIVDRQAARRLAAAWRIRGGRVVFTNGCFDLLHLGHLQYLAAAKDLGERLVVGLNSDESVRRLKGPARPIHDEATRAAQLAALFFVDAVVVFEEDDPLELVKSIEPDILVKGGDWPVEQIVGAGFVLEKGGQVLSLPFLAGQSTTEIERRIVSRNS